MYTLLAAQRVGPTGYVHAFEPTHHVAAKLVANIRLNGFGNVTVNEIAVSDCSSEATLYYVEDDGMNNILAPEPGYRHSMKVLTVTLDEYLDSRQTEKVDIIKMDIEGAELKALRGAARLLAGDDAPVVIVEINPRALAVGNATAAELVQLLEGHGYRVGTIATYGVTTRDPWLNAIAFKPMHERRWPALGERRFQPIGMK
jgi:FkbM family methyltransferase